MPWKAPANLVQECAFCTIQPDFPMVVISNGIVTITGLNTTNIGEDNIFDVYDLTYPGFSTLGVEFTAYTAYNIIATTLITDTAISYCTSVAIRVSLATPLFIQSPAYYQEAFVTVAATPFVHSINPDCSVDTFPPITSSPLTDLYSTVTSSRSSPQTTLSTSSSHISTASSMPTAIRTFTSVIDPHQSSSAGLTEANKLTIGLVVAIVVPIILITLALSWFCIVRRHRKRKEAAAVSAQDVREDQGDHTQMYFQQKVELDDEQRRHEMEANELRYEMEGEDIIHELAGEEADGRINRQELRGKEHAKELETSE